GPSWPRTFRASGTVPAPFSPSPLRPRTDDGGWGSFVCAAAPAWFDAVTAQRTTPAAVGVKVLVVAPPMSEPSRLHWYVKLRGARYRNEPSTFGAQLPCEQSSVDPTDPPPVIAGAPPPLGARSSAGKFGWLTVAVKV